MVERGGGQGDARARGGLPVGSHVRFVRVKCPLYGKPGLRTRRLRNPAGQLEKDLREFKAYVNRPSPSKPRSAAIPPPLCPTAHASAYAILPHLAHTKSRRAAHA